MGVIAGIVILGCISILILLAVAQAGTGDVKADYQK